MLGWALILSLIALLAAHLGFFGLGGLVTAIPKVLLVVGGRSLASENLWNAFAGHTLLRRADVRSGTPQPLRHPASGVRSLPQNPRDFPYSGRGKAACA